MKKLLLVLFVLCFSAQGASAEQCVTNTANGFLWSVVTGGTWAADPTEAFCTAAGVPFSTCTGLGTGTNSAGCTASADDEFAIVSGHRVVVTGTIAVTTGGIDVANGELTVGAGVQLNTGVRHLDVHGSNARLVTQGAIVARCHIVSISRAAATAATHQINAVVDCPLDDVVDATDELYFPWAGLPADLDSNLTGNVQYGSGKQQPGSYRIPYAAGLQFPIDLTVAATRTVTYDINDNAAGYTTTPNAPYPGTRHLASSQVGSVIDMDVPNDVNSCVYNGLDNESRIEVDVTNYGSVSVFNGDLLGQYIEFEDNGSDVPTDCPGMTTKVLWSQTDVAADVLWVNGNACACSTGAFENTLGERVGDEVWIVRPARIYGDTDGDVLQEGGEGGLIVRDGSTWDAENTVVEFLGAVPQTEPTQIGSLANECNVCFWLEGTAGAVTQPHWNARNVQIRYPVTNAASGDVAVLGIYSGDVSAWHFPNDGLLDCANLKVRGLTIINAAADLAGGGLGGTHGISAATPKNCLFDEVRIQNMSDDGMALYSANGGGTSTDRPSYRFRRLLMYENDAEVDLSQQIIETATEDVGTDEANWQFGSSGMLRIKDAVLAGGDQGLSLFGMGNRFNGIVATGANTRTTTNALLQIRPENYVSANIANVSHAFAKSHYIELRDSRIYTHLVQTAATNEALAMQNLHVIGSVYTGNRQLANTTLGQTAFLMPDVAEGSVFDFGMAHNTRFFADVISTNPLENYTTLRWRSNLLRSGAGEVIAQSFAAATTPGRVWERTALALGGSGAGTSSPWHSMTNQGGIYNLLGVWASYITPDTIAVDQTATVNLDNWCFENVSTTPGLTFFDVQDDDNNDFTNQTVNTLAPDADDDGATIRDFIANTATDGPCSNQSKPLFLGPQSGMPVGLAFLGDFAIRDQDALSSVDMIHPVAGGGSGGGGVIH